MQLCVDVYMLCTCSHAGSGCVDRVYASLREWMDLLMEVEIIIKARALHNHTT
jgi:hypothetical protein